MEKVKHLSLVRGKIGSADQSQKSKNDCTIFIPKSTLSLMLHLDINQELVQKEIERLDNVMNQLKKETREIRDLEDILSRLKTLTRSSRKSVKTMVLNCYLK